MSNYKLLNFDTKLFGFKVAQIVAATMSSEKLKELLKELKEQDIKLVYWATDSADESTQVAAKESHGELVDCKVTYVMSLDQADMNLLADAKEQAEPYHLPSANHELETLALLIGERSRFGVDSKLPRVCMEKMYKTWIDNCVKGDQAKHLFIIKKGLHIAGMVTMGEKNGRGDIGLISVGEKYQGQGLGKILVYAAQAQFIEEGYTAAQVVTQLANKDACRLYEKCGYHQEKIENFYHFWL